jgi:hypothetical protein
VSSKKSDASSTNAGADEMSRQPVEGLPPGWTRIVIRRKKVGKTATKLSDPYYFSPIQLYKFNSLVKVKRFLVCLEETCGDEVVAYAKFRGGSCNADTVGKKRKLTTDPSPAVEVDQTESEEVGSDPPPSTVMPPIAPAKPSSEQPTSKGTEVGVSSQGGRVGKKCKMVAHTAIPKQQEAFVTTPSAGVSSRGRQRRMSQVMAESVSQAANSSNRCDDANDDDDYEPEWLPRDDVSDDDDVSSSPMDDDIVDDDDDVSSSQMDDVSNDDVSTSRPRRRGGGFSKHIAQLEAYKAQHGHINISSKVNKSLFKYCSKLRTARRYPEKNAYSLKLTTEQIAALDSLGFDWKSAEIGPRRKKEMSFDERIVQLKAYKEMHGNFNMSKKDDYGLYYWCANMRSWKRGSSVGKLKPERIAALDAIGFEWNSPCASSHDGGSRELSFETRLALLTAYKTKHGHINVQVRDGSLYSWCNSLRSARRHPEKHILKLTPDRIAALDAIGFHWGGQTREGQTREGQNISFHTRLTQLEAYKFQHGHLNVSEKVDASLYSWCCSLRKARRHPEKHILKLTPDRIAALDAIGFHWGGQTREVISFHTRLAQLKAYKVQHGHVNVSKKEDGSLHHWCYRLRIARKHPEKHILKLTTDCIAALDSVGFDWEYQRAVVKTAIECSQDPPSSGNLTGEGNSEKEEIRFHYRLKQLQAYKDQHGHLNVNENEYNSLYKWCAKMRNARKYPEKYNRKLTTEHIAALDSVGFVWTSKKPMSFTDRIKQLRAYKAQHGHLHVTTVEDMSLYRFCYNLRHNRNKHEYSNNQHGPKSSGFRITADRIAALDSIGFDWKCDNTIATDVVATDDTSKKPMSFTHRIKQLQAYKAQHGHLHVRSVEDKSLFTWCAKLRSARRYPEKQNNRHLTADRIAALDSIGFDWKSDNTIAAKNPMSFTDRIKQLQAYKAQHGHLLVTSVEDKSLFKWCANIRSARRNPEKYRRNLTADRIAALDSIGFDWKSDNTIAADAVATDDSLWTELTIPPGKMGLRISTVDAIVGGATISTIHDTCTFRDHISVGDVILEINGVPVRTVEMFTLGMDKPRNITVIRKSI